MSPEITRKYWLLRWREKMIRAATSVGCAEIRKFRSFRPGPAIHRPRSFFISSTIYWRSFQKNFCQALPTTGQRNLPGLLLNVCFFRDGKIHILSATNSLYTVILERV